MFFFRKCDKNTSNARSGSFWEDLLQRVTNGESFTNWLKGLL